MATLERATTHWIPPTIQQRLRRLRWWIRAYVSWEGLMAGLVWLGVCFWLSLVVDWFFEPVRQVRIALWIGVLGGLGWIFFWHLLRRLAVRFTEANLAMILERRFPELNEALLTTVEVAARPERAQHFNPQMLALACREAEARLQPLPLREVFNFRPLYLMTSGALLLVLSIGMWAAMYPEAFGVWWDRVVGLSDRLWPRRTVLLVDGFDRPVKVGRGGDLELIARVDLEKSRLVPSVVYIRGRTEDGARIRATMNRIGNAQPGIDKYQLYSYTFQGLLWDVQFDLHGGDAWIQGLEIDVVDNPTVTFRLQREYPAYVAGSPALEKFQDTPQVLQGTRLTIHALANKDLEQVQIHSVLEPNRPPVTLRYQTGDPHWTDRKHFRYTIERFEQDTSLLFTLWDTDGVRSREPFSLKLAAVADQKPELQVRLRGIGQAITPQARIPVVGQLTDDYGLARVWWEYTIQTPPEKSARTANPEKSGEKSPPEAKPAPEEKALIPEKTDQTLIVSFDTPRLEYPLEAALEVSPMDLQPGQKLLLAVKAADRCDRQGGPNVGASERWTLDVVTPDQLRLMLEARELTLRQRFEVIIREVEESRELLTRIEFPSPPEKEPTKVKPQPATSNAGSPPVWPFAHLEAEPPASQPSWPAGNTGRSAEKPPTQNASFPDKAEKPLPSGEKSPGPGPDQPPPAGAEPGEQPLPPEARTPEQIYNRALLAAQRAHTTITKDRNDLLDIAEAFDQIHEELVNNRIDSERLRRRLKEGIADPMRQVAEEPMPRVEQYLKQLQDNLAHPELGPRYRFLAVQQLDAVLVQLQEILRQMIELETFNEVVATLRAILEQQEKLHQETQQYHKERLRKLLEE